MSKRKKKFLPPSRTPTRKEKIYFKHLQEELGLGSSVKLLPEKYRVRIPLKTGVVLSYVPSMVVLDEIDGNVAYHIAKDNEMCDNEKYEFIKNELAEIGFEFVWVSDEEFPFEEYD